MTKLKATILSIVDKESIKMVPKWKFFLYTIVGIGVTIFLGLLTLFLVSLLLFVLSRYGFLYMPMFGFMETLHAVHAVPPLLFICTIILLISIEVLTRKYTFTFRTPLLTTVIMFTLFVGVVSFVISQTPFHEYVREYAKEHHIDVLSQAYMRPVPFGQHGDVTVTRGTVIDVSSSTITLKLFDGMVIATVVASNTALFSFPVVGNDVVVVGTMRESNIFEVQKLRPLPKLPFDETAPRNPPFDSRRSEIK